jgi:hypothetical protein
MAVTVAEALPDPFWSALDFAAESSAADFVTVARPVADAAMFFRRVVLGDTNDLSIQSRDTTKPADVKPVDLHCDTASRCIKYPSPNYGPSTLYQGAHRRE